MWRTKHVTSLLQGLLHLKLLEHLNLYYNKIASLREVLLLRKLKALKELDLRLNPVVKNCVDYRLQLVYTLANLRMLGTWPHIDSSSTMFWMWCTISVHFISTNSKNKASSKRFVKVPLKTIRKLVVIVFSFTPLRTAVPTPLHPPPPPHPPLSKTTVRSEMVRGKHPCSIFPVRLWLNVSGCPVRCQILQITGACVARKCSSGLNVYFYKTI